MIYLMNKLVFNTTSRFDRSFEKLPSNIKKAFKAKIEIIKLDLFHPTLKTHRLKGNKKDYYAFSITYSYRVVFALESEKEVTLIDIGDHSIYKAGS